MPQDLELFDTHAHLGDDGCPDETEYYRRAEEAGVPWILLCGSDFESSRCAAEFASHFDRVFFAAGLHPLDVVKHPCETEKFEAFVAAPRFAAVGEIGLDYYYERGTREKQLEVFRSFLELALRLDRPAIVHTRDVDGSTLAYDDAYTLLADFAHAGGQFVLHSFAGSIADFERFEALGAYFGCGGMVTFKKADNIRALALRYPEDRILLETDSPYLAPVPFRGKENHPEFLPWTAHSLAALRGWSMQKTVNLTTSNAKRFFRIPPENEKKQ
ncbi:MAG: TatD family hydrolase [Lentisphaeria bacterium]|nr:TatD family hydrolase [Lentisphaeria bacterium]